MDQYSSTYEPKTTITPAELLETEGAHTFLEILEPSGTANAVYRDSTAYLDDITLDPVQDQPYRRPETADHATPDLPDSNAAIGQQDLYAFLATIDNAFLLAHDYLTYGGPFKPTAQTIYDQTRQESDDMSPTAISETILEEQQAMPEQPNDKHWPFLTALGGALAYNNTHSHLAATVGIGSAIYMIYDFIKSTTTAQERFRTKARTAAYADSFEEQVAPQLADELDTILVTDTKPPADNQPLLPYWEHLNIPPVA